VGLALFLWFSLCLGLALCLWVSRHTWLDR
jgi:hypothetical protein